VAAILGIPWLASTLLGVVGGTVSFLATYIGKRIAIILVVISACAILVSIFWGIIYGIIDQYLSPAYGGTGYRMFLPTGIGTILSLWLTAKIAFWLYSWNVKIATMKIL